MGGMRRCALSVLAMAFACASAGPPPATEPGGPALAQAGAGGPGGSRPGAPRVAPDRSAPPPPTDLVEAALVASGYTTAVARRRARAELERHLGGAVGRAARAQTERDKGRALLAALHAKGGLLGAYDARATTLKDVLERRRYNCVSASVLYNLAATRLELSVAAELLPTHARSLLSAEEQDRLARIVVETTSENGFDPDPSTQRRILGQVAGPALDGARAIVSEQGEIVDTRVLIGTIYVNRASIAQEGGALEQAERLFARGQAFATSAKMRRVLADQRAALLAQLAADDVLSEDPKRYPRAYESLKAAAKLAPEDPTVKKAVFQNLRAAAERVIALYAERGDEPRLVALAGEAAATGLSPADRSGLRAFALSEVARLRIDAGAYEGAVEAIELALREQLGPGDADLERILGLNRIAALRLAAMRAAEAGDLEAAERFLSRIAGLRGLSAAQLEQLEQDRLRALHLVGNQRIDALDYAGAAEVYRLGVQRFPQDETCRHNLVAVLERLAGPLVEAARCADAQALLREIELLEPSGAYPERARVRCLLERAKRRLDADDPAEAVSLLEEARGRAKTQRAVRDALAVAYARWIQALVSERACRRAKAAAGRLGALGHPKWPSREVRALLGSCAR